MRAVITTGPAVDPAGVARHPNVRVVSSAPHRELIPMADLVITHAGHGTTVKALAAGKPLLCLPLGRDQHDVAARAAYRGAARVLPARADARTIAETVERMLGDRELAERARALGASIRAEIETGALLDELVALAEPHPVGV